jgi:hypothetical protein
MESVYSKRIRAGKRRTYFFDVRATRSNDYYLTITESRKKFEGEGYDRHKIFLYKEDFNKFIKALTEAVDYVKTDLMPDFDFDAYNHDQQDQPVATENDGEETSIARPVIAEAPIAAAPAPAPIPTPAPVEASVVSSSNGISGNDEEVDKW